MGETGGLGRGLPGPGPKPAFPARVAFCPPLQEIRTGLGKRAAGTGQGTGSLWAKSFLAYMEKARSFLGPRHAPAAAAWLRGIQGRAAVFIGVSERSPGGSWSSDSAPEAPSPWAWL